MRLIRAWLSSKNSSAPFLVVHTISADEDIRRLKFLTHKNVFIKPSTYIDNMMFLLILAFMVLAQNNTESCNVVKKELQHHPEGTYVKSNNILACKGCQNPVPAYPVARFWTCPIVPLDYCKNNKEYRISANSFRTFIYYDLRKRIVSAETICGNTVVWNPTISGT